MFEFIVILSYPIGAMLTMVAWERNDDRLFTAGLALLALPLLVITLCQCQV